MTPPYTGNTPAPYVQGFRDAVNDLPPAGTSINYSAGYAAGKLAMS